MSLQLQPLEGANGKTYIVQVWPLSMPQPLCGCWVKSTHYFCCVAVMKTLTVLAVDPGEARRAEAHVAQDDLPAVARGFTRTAVVARIRLAASCKNNGAKKWQHILGNNGPMTTHLRKTLDQWTHISNTTCSLRYSPTEFVHIYICIYSSYQPTWQ